MSIPSIEIARQILPKATNITEIRIGGQKAVFKADDQDYGVVCIKIMLPEGSGERLYREIAIVSSNDFPNVPKIYSHGISNINNSNWIFIVEEYIEGLDLRAILNGGQRLSVSESIKLIGDLLNTVIALENCGVVHRDIKPENIVCSANGTYWLLDFGIARDLRQLSLTPTNAHFGPHTAGYAAPEQFRNMKKKIDTRSDLFSIGVVAFEALSGKHPFTMGARGYLDVLKRTESLNVASLVINGDPDNQLAKFIHLLMEKYPSRRPPTAKIAKIWFDEIVENLNIKELE